MEQFHAKLVKVFDDCVSTGVIGFDTVLSLDLGSAMAFADGTVEEALVKKFTHKKKLSALMLYRVFFGGTNPPVFPAKVLNQRASKRWHPSENILLNIVLRACDSPSIDDALRVVWVLKSTGVIIIPGK